MIVDLVKAYQAMNRHELCKQHKKASKEKILSNELTSQFERGQFCFKLNTLVVVKVDVFTYEKANLLIGAEFDAVNARCFENREDF